MANYRKSSCKTRGQKRSSTRRRRASTVRHRRSHSHRRRAIQSGG
jgi:hypothetical protein